MSTTQETCGCCSGLDAETPKAIYNLPGLPQIGYRVGSYNSFRESLLAGLSGASHPALRTLTTRDSGDFTIALCDAVACTLEVLSFYQERIANENFLRTAVERRSVLEMARLIGYELAPGVAASGYLAFTLQTSPNDPTQSALPVTIPIGTRAQSVPGPDEQPQTFETTEAIEARSEWNAMAAQYESRWVPRFRDTDMYLQGTTNNIEMGDVILIVGADRMTNSGSERWDARQLFAVEVDRDNDRTQIFWKEPLGHRFPLVMPASDAVRVYVFRQRAALFGHNAPDPRLMTTQTNNELEDLIEGSDANVKWKDFTLDATQIDLDASYPKIINGSWMLLVSNEPGLSQGGLPGYVELCYAKAVSLVSRLDFALSGKITRVEPDVLEHASHFDHLRKTIVYAQSEELPIIPRPLRHPLYGDQFAFNSLALGLEPAQVLAISGKRQRVQIADGVTGLTLNRDDGTTLDLKERDSFPLIEAPTQKIGSTYQLVAADDLPDLSVHTVMRVRLLDTDGILGTLDAEYGQIKFVEAKKLDPTLSEIALIADLENAVTQDRERTSVLLSEALVNCYDRRSMSINANVVHSTHGETVSELLGSGDAGRTNQKFTLRQSPLTYVSADTASGRASTLQLRINDLLWDEQASLYEQDGDAKVYHVSISDDAKAAVQFGDGVEGARLPTGQNNLRATYRKGLGVAGNVRAGVLSNLLTRPLGVQGVLNPVAASGGQDPETLADARDNAPLTVLTLERAVSVLDYRDFARAFAGVAKAHAVWMPVGPARGVYLTVAGEAGAEITKTSDTYIRLSAALRNYGDALIPLRIESIDAITFRLRIAVKINAAADTALVLQVVETALRNAFDFEQRDFGQGVSIDEVVAVAHQVSYIEAVNVIYLYRSGMPATRQPRLFASLPEVSLTADPLPAQLLTLSSEPLTLEIMS